MISNNIRIVADSSADTMTLEGVSFATAALKIITAQKEYVDDAQLDVDQMVDELAHYSGKSSTACPAPGDWLAAFGEAKYVFCVTITSGLSGSYESACIARQTYEEQYPGRRVFVIDSLSAGPELRLLIEKLRDYIRDGRLYEDICTAISEYKKNTGLLFMLESMKNLANNGRVNPLVAKAAGLLGIRVIGKASDKGQLELLEKSRGEKKALNTIVQQLQKLGHNGGRIRIAHCSNESAAESLKTMILSEFRSAQVEIYRCRGLCSFYAEKGGLLVGFEKQPQPV